MKKLLSVLCILMLLASGMALAEDKDVVTLKVFRSAPQSFPSWEWGKDPVSAWVTEQTGIALDITFASSKDHQEFYTLLASDMIKDYDMLFLGKLEPKLIEDGYVLALDELADKYCPEWYDVVSEDERNIHAIDGHVYYTVGNFADSDKLMNLPGARKAFSMFYNYQAMDKLGVDPATIKTLADVTAIAKRFQTELGITYPIYLNSYGVRSNIDYLQILTASSFGGPASVYPQADGTVTYNVKSDEYKAAAKWLNDMYKEGLIKADCFTHTSSINDETVKNIAQKADVGFVLGHMWFINQHRPEGNGGGVHGNGDMGLLQFAGQTPLAEGVKLEDIKVNDQNLSNIGSANNYVLDRTTHPAECIKFITFCYSDAAQKVEMYGLEGSAWTMEYDELYGYEVRKPSEAFSADSVALSAEEQRIKWGNLLEWQGSFRSMYGQNWASYPQIILEEDGVKKQYGEMLINIGGLYGSPFKTGEMTMKFTDSEDLLLVQTVDEAWKNNIAQVVLADDFEAAYAKMLSDMETVGLKDLEAKLTERYWMYDEMLNEDRNEKWNAAAGR